MSADLKNIQNKALDARTVLSLALQRAHEITTYENGEIEVEQVARKADDLEAALRMVHRLVGEIVRDAAETAIGMALHEQFTDEARTNLSRRLAYGGVVA